MEKLEKLLREEEKKYRNDAVQGKSKGGESTSVAIVYFKRCVRFNSESYICIINVLANVFLSGHTIQSAGEFEFEEILMQPRKELLRPEFQSS